MSKQTSSVDGISVDAQKQVKDVYWVEYFVAFAVSLTFGMFGVHCGWFGPTYLLLMDKTKELYIAPSESAWISGFLQIGAIPGPFLGSYLANRFGRQKAILATTIPNLLTFILVAYATNVYMLYLSRFLAGIATGITFVAAPIYVSEVASPKIRGFLNLLSGVVMPICTILEFTLIPIVSIQDNAFILIAFIGIQIVIFSCLPETPQYYMSKNLEEEAEKSLVFLRQKKDVSEELARLKGVNDVEDVSYVESLKAIFQSKAFFILVGTMVSQQFSGLVAILSYSPVILQQAQDTISVQFSLILIQIIGIIMALLGAFIIESAGRRPLFLASAGIASFATAVLATFFMLDDVPWIRSLSWTPLIAIVVFTIGISLGIITIPYLFVGELFSSQCRAAAGSIISILGSVFGLIVTLLYTYSTEAFGMSFGFWMFSVFNFGSVIFGLIWVPETKGRTLEQIQDDLKGGKKRGEILNVPVYDNAACTVEA